jgi:anti-sigma factor RsiW
MSLLTCKDFLQELNDYLDDNADPGLRAELEAHLKGCHNCWVVADTTKRTLAVFHGMEPKEVPERVTNKVMAALAQKMAERKARSSRPGS